MASAATYPVTTTKDSNDGSCTAAKCSLRDAVAAADKGGSSTIDVPTGLYVLSLGQLTVKSGASVTVKGAGSAYTTLDGDSADRLFSVAAGGSLSLSGMTLRRGDASNGGAIYTDGTLTVGNAATGVRGDVVFQDNDASGGGCGGAIYAGSAATVSLTGATFENDAASYGAGIYDDSNSPLTLTDDTFRDGTTLGEEGGALYGGGTGGLTASYDTFADNNAGEGGAIYWGVPSQVSIAHSTFDANASSDVGGALDDVGSSSTTLDYDSFTDNSGSSGGGALDLDSSSATAYNLNYDLFKGNSATDGNGGAVYWNSGTLASYDSTFVDNGAGSGGALSVSGASMSLVNDTISHNGGSSTDGGGIDAQAITPASLVNDTITDNVGAPGSGGGIASTSDLEKSLYSGSAAAGIENTVIADNTGGDCDAPFTSSFDNGHNLDSDGSCFSSGGTPVQTTDKTEEPGLGQPADNGGPTVGNTTDGSGQVLPTDGEKAGGPTVNAGSSSGCPTTDARGVARPQGGSCDIGAFELAAAQLKLRLSVPKDARTGQAFAYLATVKNSGPGYSSGTYLIYAIPSGASALAVGSTTGGPCYATKPSVACVLGDLAPGASATVEFLVSYSHAGTPLIKVGADNAEGGFVSGSARTKVTPAGSGSKPRATTGAAVSVGKSSAKLRGTVSPGGQKASWLFEYRTTRSSMWMVGSFSSTTRAGSVSQKLRHLRPGTSYSYRLVVVNGVGTSYGKTRRFRTKK